MERWNVLQVLSSCLDTLEINGTVGLESESRCAIVEKGASCILGHGMCTKLRFSFGRNFRSSNEVLCLIFCSISTYGKEIFTLCLLIR